MSEICLDAYKQSIEDGCSMPTGFVIGFLLSCLASDTVRYVLSELVGAELM